MSLVAFDKIVPFGQDFVFDDMPCTLAFKKWVTFFLCLIDSSVDRCEHGESRFGCRPGRQFACLLDGVDDGSTPGIGDLREEPVFYGVPLGIGQPRHIRTPVTHNRSFVIWHRINRIVTNLVRTCSQYTCTAEKAAIVSC